MCGIFGVIFNPDEPLTKSTRLKLLKTFNTLAVLSADRGTDSAGMAHIFKNGSGKRYRETNSSYLAVKQDSWIKNLLEVDQDSLMLMGHTRKATHGKVTVENAHPFEFVTDDGILYGTHNGVISNHFTFGPYPHFESDSANFFWTLARCKSEAELVSRLYQANGSFTLIWSMHGKVYAARNIATSFAYTILEDKKTIVYGSTDHIVKAACALSDLKNGEIYTTEPGKLYTWSEGKSDKVIFDQWRSHYGQTRKCDVCQTWKVFSYDRKTARGTSLCDGCNADHPDLMDDKVSVLVPPNVKQQKYCASCRVWSYFKDLDQKDLKGQPICNACIIDNITANAAKKVDPHSSIVHEDDPEIWDYSAGVN